MATIGMYTTWGNADMSIKALKNHLKICDKIFVSIEAHSLALEKYADSSYDDIVEFSKDNPIKIIPPLGVAKEYNHPDSAKCAILNYMLRFVTPGDVLMLCDSDEFYSTDAIEEIKEHIKKTDWDFMRIHDMFFCINLDWYVKGSHGRFWRMKPGTRFFPTQNVFPAPVITRMILKDNPMFHLSMLIGEGQRRDFWVSEKQDNKVLWLDNIYTKWDLHGDNSKLAWKNYSITGNHGFWMNTGVEEAEKPTYLFYRDFELPEELR